MFARSVAYKTWVTDGKLHESHLLEGRKQNLQVEDVVLSQLLVPRWS